MLNCNLLTHKYLFDFSNFSKDSKFYDSQNEMVAGKIKVVNKGISVKKICWIKIKSAFYTLG